MIPSCFVQINKFEINRKKIIKKLLEIFFSDNKKNNFDIKATKKKTKNS